MLFHLKKIFLKPAQSLSFLVMCILLVYATWIHDNGYNVYMEGGLCNIILVMPYLFLFFLVFSYDIFYSYQKDDFNEVLCSRRISLKYQKYDVLILFLAISLVSVYIGWYLIHFFASKDAGGEAIVAYSVRICLIYVFLVLLFAVLAGWVVSYLKNRMAGFAALLIVFYCFDKSTLKILTALDVHSRPLYKFATLFTIFNIQRPGSITDTYYLMTAENVHLYAVLFWIFLCVCVICFLCRKFWLMSLNVLISFALVLAFAMPSGASYDLGGFNLFDKTSAEYCYYNENQIRKDEEQYISNSRNDFLVKKYEMEFGISDILSARVRMTVSNPGLERYQFTLYHSYEVEAVLDQDGKPMAYEQDGDYLDIRPGSGGTESITILYRGANSYFYSTTQGIVLPANYEYYPVPGWQRVFFMDGANACFTNELGEETDFDVTLSCSPRLKVFSNLLTEETETGWRSKGYRMTGKSNGCTIVGSPYLKSMEVDGLNVVYSYLDHDNSPEYSENAQDCKAFLKYLEKKNIPYKGKTLFVTPEGNYLNVCFATDHFVDQVFMLKDDYKKYIKQGNTYHILTDEERKMMEEVQNMTEEGEKNADGN